jgi:hypothetical protein
VYVSLPWKLGTRLSPATTVATRGTVRSSDVVLHPWKLAYLPRQDLEPPPSGPCMKLMHDLVSTSPPGSASSELRHCSVASSTVSVWVVTSSHDALATLALRILHAGTCSSVGVNQRQMSSNVVNYCRCYHVAPRRKLVGQTHMRNKNGLVAPDETTWRGQWMETLWGLLSRSSVSFDMLRPVGHGCNLAQNL